MLGSLGDTGDHGYIISLVGTKSRTFASNNAVTVYPSYKILRSLIRKLIAYRAFVFIQLTNPEGLNLHKRIRI